MAFAAGCSPSYRAPASSRGPTLILIDSVALAVPDTIPLGPQLHAARGGRQSYVLGDIERYRVLTFDSAGRFARILSTRTTELADGRESSAPYVLPGDTLVAVHDWWQKVLRVYRIRDGRQTAEVPADLLRLSPQPAVRGDTMYFAGVAVDFPGPVARWVVGAPSVTPIGTSPPYMRGAYVWVVYGFSGVAVRDADVVVVIASEPGLRVVDPRGREKDGVLIRAVRRRGTPPGLYNRAAETRKRQWFQPQGSILEGLAGLPDGSLVLTYSDHDQIRPDSFPARDSLLGNYHYYVSVVSRDLSSACLDGIIPADSTGRATLVWHNDTVEVLNKAPTGLQKAPLWIRRYRLDTAECDWTATSRMPPLRRP